MQEHMEKVTYHDQGKGEDPLKKRKQNIVLWRDKEETRIGGVNRGGEMKERVNERIWGGQPTLKEI